jgi:L-amino acid N-acyltransferase YncA
MNLIRLANESDASQILRIYAPIVTQTAISFELRPPSEGEMRERIRKTLTTHAWLVSIDDDQITAYAYASEFRRREAYLWTTEVTVYVDSTARRRGHARGLYRSLFEVLRLQGYYTALAIIALPNPPSIAFHQALGFEPVGVIKSAGYKFGAWHATAWWQLELQPHVIPQRPPRPVSELTGCPQWTRALKAGLLPAT